MTPMRYAMIGLWAALMASCGEDVTFEIPAVPAGATGLTDKRVFGDDGRLLDPRGDSDGDGIPDKEEVDGWTITVDTDGYAILAATTESFKEELELRKVTSDPRYADTDGDGLDDRAERAAACDPRRVDTDGDTLSDAEELERWFTSPSSVDTDGDARGGDAENPRPPLFQLFDAAELKLVQSPTRPEVLIPGPGATVPFLSDSDGDGRGDYEETLGGVMKPTVAEVPKLSLVPTPAATMDLSLITERTDESGLVEERGTSTELSEQGYMMTGSSVRLALSHTQYAGAYVDFTAEGGCCADIASGSIEAGVMVKSEDRFDQEIRFDFEAGGAFTANQIERETREAFDRSEIRYVGARVRVPMDVVNTGLVPFRLEDLVIGLTRFDRITRKVTPIVELVGEDMTLAPGERRTLSLASDDVQVEAMMDLLADPRSLGFSASRFSLRDAEGQDFDFQMGDVSQQAVVLDVDEGGRSQRHFVAANMDSEYGISIGHALREAGVPFSAQPVDIDGVPGAEAFAIEIAGKGTELHDGPADDLDDLLPYSVTGGPGPRLIKKGWFGVVIRRGESDPTYYANLFDAPVFPGDRVTLIYTEDLDRDGVPAHEEAARGSSDLMAHSDGTAERPDGDGLSDFWEACEGWVVETAGRAPYRVYPSPAQIDSDRDGLRDDEEVAGAQTDFGTGTDPWTADTDEDGLSDEFEADDPLGYGFSPLDGGEARPAPVIECMVSATFPADTWQGAPACFVAVYPGGLGGNAWQNEPGVLVPCSAFTKIGAIYRATVSHPNPPNPDTPTLYDYVAEVPTSVMEAAAGTTIPRQAGSGGFPGYIEPVGRSTVCDVIVRTDSLTHAWVRAPCVALRDLTGQSGPDGVCETFAPCQIEGFGQCPDEDLEFDRGDPIWRDNDDEGVRCVGVLPTVGEPAPFFELRVDVSDEQDDLVRTEVTFEEVDGFMVYTHEPQSADDPRPEVDYEVRRRFESCVDPTLIKVAAVDSIGSRGEGTCAWTPPLSDGGVGCRPVRCGETEVQACISRPAFD